MDSRVYASFGVTTLAAILAISMIVTPAFAAQTLVTDDSGDAANADFDILTVQAAGDGNLRLTVDGTAGGTTPDETTQADLVYAYVFITDAGIIAVTSHQAEDSAQVGNDLEWHTHRVTLDANFCVTGIEDFGKAKFHDNRLTVSQTGATEVAGALTAELTIDEGVCVSEVFDLAPDNLLG
jgi:hypothetical protein